MNRVGLWLLVVLVLFYNVICINVATRPEIVTVGAMFSFISPIGKPSKIAIDAAVEDINSNPGILKGTKLRIEMMDTNYSGFLGIVEALRFMEKETVAIIGPQSSVTAHAISHIANVLQLPLLSFASTDPTLSPIQFPFFVRTAQNDLYQMAAIAELVDFYGWREVIAIYEDDDHGRNGIAALGDKLAERRGKISYKAALSPNPTQDEITNLLVKIAMFESRIIVVHVPGSWGPKVFSVAQQFGMLSNGYVWIATSWLSTVLDTNSPLGQDAMDNIQGVLTLRMYTPQSELKRKFISRWSNLTRGKVVDGRPIGLNAYALYAYDTVWLLARALDAFFEQGGNISFSNQPLASKLRGGNLHLNTLNVFDGGKLLLRNILQISMNGLTGQVRFTSDRNLIHPAFEVINVVGNGYRKIGCWSNHSGLSILPPEALWSKPPNRSSSNQKLRDVIWPGQTTEKPRGWIFPNSGRHLKIGVPNRVSYREFVLVQGQSISGYCIDVFTAALNFLPYAVPYKLIAYGDGRTNPSGTELVSLITAGVFDAVIGDIAITTNRTRMADFTQPYIQSGLAVVAPVKNVDSGAWAFLRPFTGSMWGVTAIFFLVVGSIVWILEHRLNDDFRGPPRRQAVTILWFSFSTWFFAHRENIVSTMGRLILIIWLFVVLIINSSYTASLTSILTVQQLSSPIKGIETLKSSSDPIGYQQGSYAQNYLINELSIHESRLKPFNSLEESAQALKDGPSKGGVVAMVDDRAYLELFLSSRCEFSIVGQEFTKNGWGFAFPKDSPLAVDMSTAILKLSENGDLQRIHDKWLLRRACSSQGAKTEVDRLPLKSFWGLFVICALACLIALLLHFLKMVRQFSKHYPEEPQYSSRSSPTARLQTFFSFFDEKEDDVRSRSKRRQIEGSTSRSCRTDRGSTSNPNYDRGHIDTEISSNNTTGNGSQV
ncbi:hypothetical protein SLEP1_g39057 [Rubroshorea leprosula]|uniref:Glutamate receptor n=1 Tax=Rubroshorea leprosula TaxID=152421 RepID=A0AAV5KYZ5_9ROSI|nr:hypothetical protein SLEP1_g39057 [Rubroshorea leprosula]